MLNLQIIIHTVLVSSPGTSDKVAFANTPQNEAGTTDCINRQ